VPKKALDTLQAAGTPVPISIQESVAEQLTTTAAAATVCVGK